MDFDLHKQTKKLNNLANIKNFAEKVEITTEDLVTILSSSDTLALDPIKPLIQPRKNIHEIISIYEIVIMASKKIAELETKLNSSGLLKNKEEGDIEISQLEKDSIATDVKFMQETIEKLGHLGNIKICSLLLKQYQDLLDRNVSIIAECVLSSLKRLPKVVDKIDLYARIVLNHSLEKDFLKKYTDVCHMRLGFTGIDENQNMLLQRTKKLSSYFNMIKNLNLKILGVKYADKVNAGLIKILAIELKLCIGSTLLKVEKNASPFDIPFLTELYSRLQHQPDENIIYELEDLFDIKGEIIKLIFNCFVNFFGLLDLTDKCRQDLRAEKLCKILSKSFKHLKQNPALLKECISQFGNSFGVHDSADLFENFSGKCLLKISSIASELDIVKKSIYMINNLTELKEYIYKYEGLDVDKHIYKFCETILGVIKINVQSSVKTEVYNKVFKEIASLKNYYLPEKEKTYLQRGLIKIIDGLVLDESISGNIKELTNSVKDMFIVEDN